MSEGFFGIHTASDFPRSAIHDFVVNSSVIKMLIGNWDDAHYYHEFHTWNPDAIIVGRYSHIDLNILHADYKAIKDAYEKGHMTELEATSAAFELGVEFAGLIAKPAIEHNLTFVKWEGGPNEINDSFCVVNGIQEPSMINVSYNLGFGHTMNSKGLQFLLGNQSYGRPEIMELDGIDGWAHWAPVFDLIDICNRDANGKPLENWRAGLQLHGYGNKGTLTENTECTVFRHEFLYNEHILPRNLYVPLVLGELGFATDKEGDFIPSTEELVRQLKKLDEMMLKYWYLAGYCFWDFRGVNSDEPGSGWSYCYSDILRAISGNDQRIVVPPGSVVPVPPDPPDPPAEEVECVMRWPENEWINMRILPSLEAEKIDKFVQSDSIILSGDDLAKVGQRDSWIFVDGTQQNACKKGWLAAWCLKRKEL